jgi:hypothetical protein
MGIRGFMNSVGLEWVGGVVLIVAFVTFVAIVIWTLTRPQRTVDRWAQLPLGDETPPSRGSAKETNDG